MTIVHDAIAHWDSVAPLLRAPETEADYDTLVANLDTVLAAGGHDEAHPLASLAARMGDLIEAYDNSRRPMPAVTGVDVLRYLMEEHGLAQGSLPEVGTQSVVSEILAGRRALNIRQVRSLAKRFNLPADVFIDQTNPSDAVGPKRFRLSPKPEAQPKKAAKLAGIRGSARAAAKAAPRKTA